MALTLYNSMNRSKEEFRPREGHRVKVFTCGPSIYRRPHLGNYRTFLYEDLLVKYLIYLGYEVRRVINFTDVEDKTLEEAAARKMSLEELTRGIADIFFAETALLKIQLPAKIPSATTSVNQAARLIERLVAAGYAYWYKGDVFFDPLKVKGFGRLYGLDMSRWPKGKVRFKKDTYNGQRWNRGDFILWHGHQDGSSAAWDTKIGRGRPSWNIQDPAMITENLGEQVDINCGGIDNIYRHHDYNIAIMEALSGKEYARYFLHGAHLIVDGKTMSKSRDNVLYPEDVLKKGYEPRHLRFFLLYTHYRKKLNFTFKSFDKAARHLDAFRGLARELTPVPAGAHSVKELTHLRAQAGEDLNGLIDRFKPEFEQAMNDDLDAGRACEGLYALLQRIKEQAAGVPLPGPAASRIREELKKIDSVLAVIF